jgi:ketosteroid isomerase-like protein
MWGTWSYNGLEAWRGMVADWFGTLGTERVAVGLADVRTIVSQGVAVAYALVTYTGISAEGRELRAMHNRLTWALEQKRGTWKIVHEHTSAPIDFETSKVVKRGYMD